MEDKLAIYQLAIQGRLTTKWREVNPHTESANVLFENINPRIYKWSADTLAHPNSMQNMMRTIWGSSANNVYIAGHTSADGDMYHYNGKETCATSFDNLH